MPKLICPHCGYQIDENDDYHGGSNYICRGKCQDMVIPKIVQEVLNDVRDDDNPHCFSYHDGRDASCRRCGVKEACEANFIETRPECFGLEYGSHAECDDCLDSSQCIERQKELEMTTKRGTRRRRRRKEEVVEEPVVVEEEDTDDEAEEDYTAWSVPDLREELKARELDNKGRKSVLVKRLLADDSRDDEDDEDDEPEEEEEEEEEAPVQVKRTRTRVRKSAPPLPPVVEAEADVPAVAQIATDATPLSELTLAIITHLNAGQIVSVTAMPGGYSIALGDVQPRQLAVAGEEPIAVEEPKAKGLRGEAFYQEVWTPEYYHFMKEDAGTGTAWGEMSADDKYELADDLDLEWDEHEDGKVDMMRLVKALFANKGITKYKDAYKSPAARKALR